MIKKYGLEAVFAICEFFGGHTVYVPSARTIFARCLEREAKSQFNGNVKELSRKFGFTERHMRRMLNRKGA
jgi:Mor family transcriptional regulator